jgi:hypothetical protein
MFANLLAFFDDSPLQEGYIWSDHFRMLQFLLSIYVINLNVIIPLMIFVIFFGRYFPALYYCLQGKLGELQGSGHHKAVHSTPPPPHLVCRAHPRKLCEMRVTQDWHISTFLSNKTMNVQNMTYNIWNNLTMVLQYLWSASTTWRHKTAVYSYSYSISYICIACPSLRYLPSPTCN